MLVSGFASSSQFMQPTEAINPMLGIQEICYHGSSYVCVLTDAIELSQAAPQAYFCQHAAELMRPFWVHAACIKQAPT